MGVLTSSKLANMIRIALIDDDLSMRKAISRLLRTHGFSCSAYASGEPTQPTATRPGR